MTLREAGKRSSGTPNLFVRVNAREKLWHGNGTVKEIDRILEG